MLTERETTLRRALKLLDGRDASADELGRLAMENGRCFQLAPENTESLFLRDLLRDGIVEAVGEAKYRITARGRSLLKQLTNPPRDRRLRSPDAVVLG